MIYIPTELTQGIEVSTLVVLVGAFISVVFRQSAAVSMLFAKVLVGMAFKIINFGGKWSKEHKVEVDRLASDWHILKSKLKGDKIGKG